MAREERLREERIREDRIRERAREERLDRERAERERLERVGRSGRVRVVARRSGRRRPPSGACARPSGCATPLAKRA